VPALPGRVWIALC